MDEETQRAFAGYIGERLTGAKSEEFAAELQAFCNSGQVPPGVDDKGAYHRGMSDCRDEAVRLVKKHFARWI